MWLAAARRLALIYAAVLLGTGVVSLTIGLLVDSILRSLAVGYYLAGAALLVGCFLVGVRGPLRGVSDSGDTVPVTGARRLRRATPDERSEAARTAILLFVLGLSLVVIGSLFDPGRATF